MRVIRLDSADERKIFIEAVSTLRSGGMIVYPTETVYGLGVDATSQEAVNTLLKFKGQRGRKPVLIAVSNQQMAEEYADLNDVARRLYRTFLPGPMAIISKKRKAGSEKFAKGIASVDNTIGIRIPSYPLVLKIIRAFGKPITSTSANVSGSRNPWSINDIIKTTPKNKLELIDFLLDAGQLPKRSPSTVVDTSREKTEVIREGYLAERLKAKGQRTKEETFISYSPGETIDLAKRLVNGLFRPSSLSLRPSALVLALQGPLGAGKTVFAKGIARALGIAGPIRSPSYTLVREYSLSGKRKAESGKLFHIDIWRLHDPSEFQDLGLERMMKPGNVIVIEWIERLLPLVKFLQLQANMILVKIEVESGTTRRIRVSKRNNLLTD